jgi:hypothetical protein
LILEALNVHLDTISVETDATVLPLGQLMKKEEYLTRLIGVLTKFTRDQSDWSPGELTPAPSDEFSIVLNNNVSIEVKAVVYEIQVHVLLGMTHEGRYAIARNICGKALDIYAEANCTLRRARVLERLLYLAVVTGEDTEDLLALGSSAISSLTSTKVYLGNDLADSRHLVKMKGCIVRGSLFWLVVFHGWVYCRMQMKIQRMNTHRKRLQSGPAGLRRQSMIVATWIKLRWQTSSKFWVEFQFNCTNSRTYA